MKKWIKKNKWIWYPVFFGVMAIAMIVICIIAYNHEEPDLVGEKVVIMSDTLLIVDREKMGRVVTLSDGREIRFDLAKKLVLETKIKSKNEK